MAFIHKYSTISKGNLFNHGILYSRLNKNKEITDIHPDYKKAIPKINLRRMSKIVKMGLANSLNCISTKKPDAIIVATGIGSLQHTELFLSSFVNTEQSILSPTPFINSVHNTISGQIALYTGNKGYNSTYSQNSLSFEGSLLDAIMLTKEGKTIIIGGVDESIPILEETLSEIGTKNKFATGSTFFNIDADKTNSLCEITECIIIKKEKLKPFMESNFNSNQDFIIEGISHCNIENKATNLEYSKFCGIYMTNSAFGMQLGVELLNSNISKLDGYTLPPITKRIFIVNYASKDDISIIILKK
tara:strand:- start:600 stop:1508 length:909 start_codon:yes stop_codon:yes gene_type:complete